MSLAETCKLCSVGWVRVRVSGGDAFVMVEFVVLVVRLWCSCSSCDACGSCGACDACGACGVCVVVLVVLVVLVVSGACGVWCGAHSAFDACGPCGVVGFLWCLGECGVWVSVRFG